MASIIGNAALKAIVDGTIDLNTSDIRAALLMTNTTADTEIDSTEFVYVGDFTTLDECDSTGYARVALANEAVNIDDTNNRAEFDADDVSFTGLGGDATRDIQGVLLYKHARKKPQPKARKKQLGTPVKIKKQGRGFVKPPLPKVVRKKPKYKAVIT